MDNNTLEYIENEYCITSRLVNYEFQELASKIMEEHNLQIHEQSTFNEALEAYFLLIHTLEMIL